MDPDLSEAHRQQVAKDPDILVEGYATTAEHKRGADYYWICESCFADFAERFQLQVLPSSD